MRVLSSSLMMVSAIGLAGCVVEPNGGPRSADYGRPAPIVQYDRGPPPGGYDRDHAFREHDEHDRDYRQPGNWDRDPRAHEEHDRGEHDRGDHDRGGRPPDDHDHRFPG